MYPEFTTERLLLRRWNSQDVVPFALINEDPRVMEFMPRVLTRLESKQWIDDLEQHFEKHGFGLWAVEHLKTQRLIGYTGIHIPRFASLLPCVEIGWRFAFDVWGNGYATEAARAALKFGFEQAKLQEIRSFTVPANERSWRVMQRIGMNHDPTRSFHHPALPADHPLSYHVLFRLTREDWLAQKRR
ncbi:MAG: GNAT family N-acetyltransferase [Candidatus Methylacidiphilales bacterium]|nr:GNAT family N-acetyltransferase [Candidatus Methylacidiphilales bacterium]